MLSAQLGGCQGEVLENAESYSSKLEPKLNRPNGTIAAAATAAAAASVAVAVATG